MQVSRTCCSCFSTRFEGQGATPILASRWLSFPIHQASVQRFVPAAKWSFARLRISANGQISIPLGHRFHVQHLLLTFARDGNVSRTRQGHSFLRNAETSNFRLLLVIHHYRSSEFLVDSVMCLPKPWNYRNGTCLIQPLPFFTDHESLEQDGSSFADHPIHP